MIIPVVSAPIVIRNRHGREFNLLDIQPDDLSILDLAGTLAQLNRFGGHAAFPYSVATHSVFVSCLVTDEYAFDAICHDLTEGTGLGDLITPLKRMCPEYVGVETRVRERLADLFGFSRVEPGIVKTADLRARVWESHYLRGTDPPPEERPEERSLADRLLSNEVHWLASANLFLEHYEWAKAARGTLH